MSGKNNNYWKVESNHHGTAGNIDHTNPDYETVIFLMERRGEL